MRALLTVLLLVILRMPALASWQSGVSFSFEAKQASIGEPLVCVLQVPHEPGERLQIDETKLVPDDTWILVSGPDSSTERSARTALTTSISDFGRFDRAIFAPHERSLSADRRKYSLLIFPLPSLRTATFSL